MRKEADGEEGEMVKKDGWEEARTRGKDGIEKAEEMK